MTDLPLRAAAGLRTGDGTSLVPPWIAPAFLLCAAILLPWTALLFVTLPYHYGANHWRLAWGGFDIMLGLALVFTAIAALRRSPMAEVAATVTGTVLVCDAWFDVLTSHGTSDIAQAVASALLIELPIAGVCFWVAWNFAHAMETARPHLRAAGFTIRGRKLIPPESTVRHAGK
jgi:hypothetical protein